MRILVPTLSIAALALTGCALSPAETARAQEAQAASRAALDAKLAGLHPAGMSDCMDEYRTSSTSLSAYGATLVYRVSSRLAYVNETTGGCEGVERGDILITRTNSSRLCRGDIAQTISNTSRVFSGSCSLGSFTTYRR